MVVHERDAGDVMAREGAWAEVGKLQAAHTALESRLRFIREVAEGKLNVFSLSRVELLDALGKAGYPAAHAGGGCEYLLTTDVSCMTVDGVERLEREREDARVGIKAAKASAALFAREQLKARMEALGQKKMCFEEALGLLASHRETLERDAEGLQEEVKTKMAAVEVALSSREAELLVQVGRVEQTKKAQLADARDDLQRTAAALTSSIEDVESLLGKTDPYDFLEAAAAVEATIEESLRKAERGFTAPDASFKLKIDTEPQMMAIRQIQMSESGVGPGGGRGGRAQASPQLGAQTIKDSSGASLLGSLASSSLSLPATHPGADERKGAEESSLHSHAIKAHSDEGGCEEGGGEALGVVDGESAGGKGNLLESKAGSGGGRGAPKVEKTQIHMISPGVSGRERSSIITVSSTFSARTPQESPSLIGGHRYRGELAGGGAGASPEPGRSEPGMDGSPMSRSGLDGAAARRLQELVQWGAGGGLLKLGGIALSEEELGSLGRVVASNPGLTTIDMTDSNIGDAGVAAVAEALMSNHSSVTALGLSGNKIGDGGIRHIARLLEPGSALASLFLRNNSVGADGARELAAALRSNTCLLKLNLKNNALGEAGARELAGMLAHNTTLTELNVWDNQLGPGGARALAEAVAEPGCRLLDLDLGCNQVGNLGVAALAVPLQGNASLTRLNLRWNEIDDEGLEVLAAALPTNTLLSEVHLFGNSFSQDCSSVLAGKISSSLKVLK